MIPEEALAFVREQGVVLVSAKGPVPRITEFIVGGPIRGSWWAHPRSHEIFRLLQAIEGSADVLACRLVDGKVTFVHRRLWPALIRAARHFPAESLARAVQEHSPAGHHIRRDVAFPDWVDAETLADARAWTEEQALDALGDWARRRRS